jgi:hypothetical protein
VPLAPILEVTPCDSQEGSVSVLIQESLADEDEDDRQSCHEASMGALSGQTPVPSSTSTLVLTLGHQLGMGSSAANMAATGPGDMRGPGGMPPPPPSNVFRSVSAPSSFVGASGAWYAPTRLPSDGLQVPSGSHGSNSRGPASVSPRQSWGNRVVDPSNASGPSSAIMGATAGAGVAATLGPQRQVVHTHVHCRPRDQNAAAGVEACRVHGRLRVREPADIPARAEPRHTHGYYAGRSLARGHHDEGQRGQPRSRPEKLSCWQRTRGPVRLSRSRAPVLQPGHC